jgi:hypothetical protein
MNKTTMVSGMNEETYHVLFDDIYGDYYNPNLKVLDYLDYYTILSPTALQMLPEAKKNKYNLAHFFYDQDRKFYYYRDKNIYFKFWKISDQFNDEKMTKELTSSRRYGNCHEKSINMCKYFKGSKVLTGYIIVDKCLVIHSVIELNNGNIFDWTKNVIMSKADYMKLTFFRPINAVKSEDIIKDSKDLFKNVDLYARPYLLFRDEIINNYSLAKTKISTTRK